jgi:hypothetical protein
LGIISVGFHITDQLLIRLSAFMRYGRKSGSTMRQYMLFMDLKKAYNSIGKEVLYSILIDFGVRIKLIRLIKIYFYETLKSL